ncbi:DUF1338 domain-containing protein [Hahella aquimaris]|uniref:DUF1338 domain-containing protein n=1 Tax=Hahella sp. HNIBRBA332 TaxID=3015983 RepID=UPI00273CC268|nr:DUF1338 domain-containing protein [Hahella sp. HNIBRBA332]WLQ11775.1 DUF1338 domain-containing protein [Hahella sp. HNIBRBA332]
MQTTALFKLLSSLTDAAKAQQLLDSVQLHPIFAQPHNDDEPLNRAVIAQAMNMMLFDDLLERVPEGKQYVAEKLASGEKVVFDHGALRTVAWENQALPMGYKAFARILEPLGFTVAGQYPLPKLKMCGFVYTHADLPHDIAQYFVSELYPEQFTKSFQDAVDRVVSVSSDPLTPRSAELLQKLAAFGALPLADAAELLPNLLQCFDRQHGVPHLHDYLALREESAEMAWISTEGNAFNHATDRVGDIRQLDAQQRALGRPMKDEIEVARNANIMQTAYRATKVKRQFKTDQGVETHEVPGSFFEFIQRNDIDDSVEKGMDLRFDSSNAQGIFTMTRAVTQTAETAEC